ncbi:MAG TPA: polysaccharide pyruvyl transferase CsaB [Symbiobacteriaceae bacterium]|nr:polysaccharide pyruvyl transferase CsaB [Symbiobacteriaceae bacterium]
MAEILVSGYYGFHNAGDEAILAGMIRAVRAYDPEVRFTVISGTAAQTRAMHDVQAVSRGDFRNIWRAMGRANLFISGGGTLIQDITSTKSLTYYLGLMTMAKLRLRPVMIYAQGAGPVTRAVNRALVPAVVNGVDLITTRDADSAATFRHLGVFRPPVKAMADPALALGPADPERGADLLKEAGVDLKRPILGVSVRPWSFWQEPVEPGLAKALDQLASESGAQVVFIPMNLRQDVEEAAKIAGLMESPAILARGQYTYDQIQAMIARCDLLVGLRYHALVFAAMNAVPLVGLSYDPKNEAFLRQIGETVAGATNRLDVNALLASGRRALSDAPAIRQRLAERIAELTPLAHENARLAIDLLKRRGKR